MTLWLKITCMFFLSFQRTVTSVNTFLTIAQCLSLACLKRTIASPGYALFHPYTVSNQVNGIFT